MAKNWCIAFRPWQCCQSGIGADVGNMCVSAGALSGRFDVCEGWSSWPAQVSDKGDQALYG
jgi:hypothetical protein